jgi:coproporphyrinogen III oxidase-like Fe-S oxidoreductase
LVAGRDPTLGTERLTDEQIRLERFYLGLRTADGADLTEASSRSVPILEPAVERGWLTVTGNKVRATLEGWLRLDALVAGLTTSVEGG